ncbi:MAG: hypothetical protein JNJ54_18500 [Myxococcaceae bacterium]|nr:hypothetical protein [Myxococcaceae bacterium]
MTDKPSEISREQTEQLFEKLRSKTVSADLKWTRLPFERAAGLVPGDGIVRAAFCATLEGATFAAIEYDRRVWYDGGRDDYTLVPEILCSIIDGQNRVFDFQYARGLSGLMDAIKAQVFQIPALVERILQTA